MNYNSSRLVFRKIGQEDRMPRKILAMLGVSLMVAAPFFALYVTFRLHETHLNRSGREYVNRVVPLLCHNWDSSAFLCEASPEYRDRLVQGKEKGKIQLFANTYGFLKECHLSQGRVFFPWITNTQRAVVGRYQVLAYFKKGPAVFQVGIILKEGHWKLLYFDLW